MDIVAQNIFFSIIIPLVLFIIPIAIILVVVRYFRQSQKLKREQNELLRKIAEK